MRLRKWPQFGGCLGVCLWLCACESPVTLSREKMNEDFDHLAQILHDVYPTDIAGNIYYGIDIDEVMGKYRNHIQDIKTDDEFRMLLQETLFAMKGNHLGYNFSVLKTLKPFYENQFGKDAVKRNANLAQTMLRAFYLKNPIVPLVYYKGEYYIEHDFSYAGKYFPAGLKLMKINGESYKVILAQVQDKLTKYDPESGVFYGQLAGTVGDNFYLFSEPESGYWNFVFADKCEIEYTLDIAVGKEVSYNTGSFRDFLATPKVLFLPSCNVLYIRIPSMRLSLLPYYRSNILKKAQGRNIEAVMIDIRYNGGGNDRLWKSLLQLLIKDEITGTAVIGLKSAPSSVEIIAKYVPAILKFPIPPSTPMTFLNDQPFILFPEEYTLEPAENSLKLECPIYILTDEVYSSSGSMLRLAEDSDQITSVGLSNPCQLGLGVTPICFMLPNSEFIFRMSPFLDVSGAESVKELYHLEPEEYVEMTLDGLIAYRNSDITGYLWLNYWIENAAGYEQWLTGVDPFFRKAMELKQNQLKK